MAVGKRQLVLAALVVALGAAVYLNAVFNGNNAQLPATQAVASGTDAQYGQTLYVNGSAVSGKKNVSSAKAKTASSASSKAGSAVKTAASATGSDDYFSQAKLSREKAQDEATEEIAKILANTSATEAVHKDAVAKAAVITQNIIKQSDLETLIKAKGYSDCVVTLGNGQCSVVVKTKQNSQNDAVVIQDIVSGQTGLAFDKIRIIERT